MTALRRRATRVAVTAATLLVALASRRAAAQELGLPLGTRAPAAAVETLDGRAADLTAVTGRGPVLIEFWATWCPNCKALEPQMKQLAARYAGRIRLVGVAVSVNQSPERVRAYAAKYQLPLELYYDRNGKATSAYDVPATSYVVVLDRSGKVVYTGQGAEQNLDAAVRPALR
ncbi:MAG TPA: TlpA disulfide reductase family protein [Gemmatirosa sp.]